MGFWSDAGNAVGSALDTVGNAAQGAGNGAADVTEDVVDVIVEAVESGADAIDQEFEGNPVTPFVGGVVVGVFRIVYDIVAGTSDVIRDVADIVGGIFKRDIVGVVQAILSLIGHVVALGVVVVRTITLGYFVGAIAERYSRSELRRFVDNLISSTFPDQLTADRIRLNVGLTGKTNFGFPLLANHRFMMIDSATITDLVERHETGQIDLYHLAGLASDWLRYWEIWPRARTEGYVVDESGQERMITRFHIARFLESGGREYRLRFYSMTMQARRQHMRIAERLHKQLGVKLLWNQPVWFPRLYPAELNAIEIRDWDSEFLFGGNLLSPSRWLVQRGIKQGGGQDLCNLEVISAFRIADGSFGVTYGATGSPAGGNTPAASGAGVAGRDDRCGQTFSRNPENGAAVVYRDAWPPEFFQYVLAHEIGHYVGLCHFGHDSFSQVMWTPAYAKNRAAAGAQAFVDADVLRFYFRSEPHFTFSDAKNCWRYLLTEMVDCVNR